MRNDILPTLFEGTAKAEWWLKNPLLLKHCPERCAKAAERIPTRTDAEIQALGELLRKERNRLHATTASEGLVDYAKDAEWQVLLAALQVPEVERGEFLNVRAFAFALRRSEWPWLLRRVREVVDRRRAVVVETELLAA